MDYVKSYCHHEGVDWINHANEQACESILSAHVKRGIEHSIRLLMELFCASCAEERSLKGESHVYGLY